MLTLIYKILMLLQSLKCSSPISYWSTYWQTTYATDKVPDYWNHGSIYATRSPQTKKVDIFSSWLARAITIPSRIVTETSPIDDYEIYIYKTSTDKLFNINNAEMEKEAKALKADPTRKTARTPLPQIEESRAKSINPNSIFLRALAIKHHDFTHPEYETTLEDINNHPPFTTKNPIVIGSTGKSIIAESILRRATPRHDRYHFTRPEYDTTVDDYDAHPTTMHTTVITEESDSIITENIFPTTAPRPEKYHFTRLELETTVYDDDAHRPYSNIKPKVTKSTEESESNSIIADSMFTTTAPRSEKYNFTHPELETTVYDDDAHRPYSSIKPKVTKSTEETESNSIIADSMFTRTAPRSEKYHYTRPEYDTTVYNYDAHPPYSPVKPSVIKTTKESESNSIITDKIFTTIAPRPEKYHFTGPEYETIVYNDGANPAHSTIKPDVTKPTKESVSNSIIAERVFTKTPQTTEKEKSMKLDTTVYDDNAHRPDSIMNLSVTKTTKKSESSSIIADSIFTTQAPRPEKDHFRHPEYDRTVYDYNAHPTSSTTHTTVIKEESDSIITHAIFTKIPPTRTKKLYTRIEYGKIVYYDIEHPPIMSPIMNARVMTSKKEFKSNPLFTKSIFTRTDEVDFTRPFETPIYEDDIRLMASIKGLSRTTQDKTKLSLTQLPTTSENDAAIHDNHASDSASMTQASTPDYDVTIYGSHPTSIIMTLSPTVHQTTQNELATPTLIQIPSLKVNAPLIRAFNQEMVSDTFSVFMRKLFIVLSVKRVEDLPVLLDQFREYLWMLLTNGQLGELGSYINSFLAKTVIILEQYPYEKIRNLFTEYQKALNNRYKQLPKDINDIIDYMDDTYTRNEEEAMQAVLKEASLFPNSKQNNKIAQGLIDYVFLKPMQRLVGTTRGNTLFKMMTEALKIRDTAKANHDYIEKNNEIRRSFNFGKTRSHLSKSTVRSSYEVTTLNQLYRRKQRSEGKSDSDIDNPSENSKLIKSSHDLNEHSYETENSEETKESKFYVFKDNDKFGARNSRQHRPFTSANQSTTRARKIRKNFSTLKNSRYPLKTRLRTLANNIAIRLNAFPNKHRRTTTVNSPRFIETTDSSNIEMKLKVKNNEQFKRVNFHNYNASRRMKHSFTSTINVPDDSHESDIERVLKNNIYKAMKKLYQTNAKHFSM